MFKQLYAVIQYYPASFLALRKLRLLGFADESPNRVGADLRCLYAVGEIDDYELLKRDIGESLSVLSNMDIRIKDRLRNCKVSTPAQVT